MTTWLSSPSMVDLVLLVVALEAAWLLAARRLRPAQVMLALLPGVILLLALRAALAGLDGVWIAGLLAASFPAHLADLAHRRAFATRR